MEASLETQTLICQTIVIKELKLENQYFQQQAQSERSDCTETWKVEVLMYALLWTDLEMKLKTSFNQAKM